MYNYNSYSGKLRFSNGILGIDKEPIEVSDSGLF